MMMDGLICIFPFIIAAIIIQMQKDHPSPHSKSKDRRPPTLAISKVLSQNHKWRQCKVFGRNMSIRSYSAACAFQKQLYLYGGHQILNGALRDFYRISLDDEQTTYHWEEIVSKGDVHPGSRSKHALLAARNKIYLIGGLKGNNEATHQIFEYDPNTNEWALVQPKGVKLPPIQSFSAVTVGSGEEQRIVIGFGFDESASGSSNIIYELHPGKNTLSLLFQGSTQKDSCNSFYDADGPSPRIGCAMTTDSQRLYIFGGKAEGRRLNDLWSFSLTDFRFVRMKDDGELPAVRNGHSMNYHQGKLYVFGGIHDITWELDDLHIYSLKNSQWTTLEQDSPRKVQKKTATIDHSTEDKHQNRKKKDTPSQSAHLIRTPHPTSAHLHSPSSNFHTAHEIGSNQHPGKMLNEQRKKLFMVKKAEMLASFEPTKGERQRLIALETESQAMKNSLDIISTPVPQHKLSDFGKQSVSHFLEPLQNSSSIVIGKRPCARDGHCAVVMGEELVIFGGDRHQMSFNDIYKLNLTLAVRSMKEPTVQ